MPDPESNTPEPAPSDASVPASTPDAGSAPPPGEASVFGRRIPPVKPPLLRPRKVRGGIKIPAGDVASPTAWAAQRWLRLMEQAAEGPRLVEALEEYARAGQTKRITFLPGKVDAQIQGRADRPYATQIAFESFTHETWDKVVDAMADGALYAAKLLAGELPPNIEDVFAPLGIKLFPVETAEVKHACGCADWRQDNGRDPTQLVAGRWCKHVCCVAYLLAQKLASEPFMIFQMRGLEGHELLERLRQRRVAAGAGLGFTPVYAQRVAGVADMPQLPLEQVVDQFWDPAPTIDQLDLALSPPPVSHPLLRRLGQSPFAGAQFPLVGLLASCYDTISQEAKSESLPGSNPEASEEDSEASEQE
jgi:uncharacterized Zn finger protein